MKALGFRQANAWLHTWVGLLLGWLLYAVFLTGTLSFFQEEITFWMKPELHASVPDNQTARPIIRLIPELAHEIPRPFLRPYFMVQLPFQRSQPNPRR